MKDILSTCKELIFVAQKWVKNNTIKFIIGIGIVVSLIIPLVINIIFKKPAICSYCEAEWSAADALSYFGTILATAFGIIGVYLSIEYAQKNYREDEIKRVLPFFSITAKYAKKNVPLPFPGEESFLFSQDDKGSTLDSFGEYEYKEYKLTDVYIVLEDDSIIIRDKLTDIEYTTMLRDGFHWEEIRMESGIIKFSAKYGRTMHLPLEFVNLGQGHAVNVGLQFFKYGNRNKGKSVRLYNIKADDCFNLHLFSKEITDQMLGTYYIILYYYDIFGHCYYQKHKLILKIDDTGTFTQAIDIYSKQEVYHDGQTANGNP